jgi:hypothetical protein
MFFFTYMKYVTWNLDALEEEEVLEVKVDIVKFTAGRE